MPITPPNIPALSSKVDPEVRKAIDALKAYYARAGKLVSVADLVDAGIATEVGGGLVPTETGGDTTVPPAITGFTVTGAFNTIILTWDDPRYKSLAYVEVRRAEVDDLGVAVTVGTTIANVYTDTPPDSSLSVTYYYWVRCVSKAGVEGPWNDTHGTAGSTADDPTYLLEVLTNQIKEGQLYGDLAARIDKIDAPGTGLDQIISDLADKQLEYIARQYDEQFLALMREKNISDATVNIDPVTGEITLKASANVTTDVEARISALEFDMDAGEGKVALLTHTVDFDRVSMTDYTTEIAQLQGEIDLKASTAYVDNAMIEMGDSILPETADAFAGDTPFAVMNLILHANKADLNSLLNKANIAQAQFDIKTNADAISAEATARLLLAAKVDQNASAIASEQTARANADSAEASARTALAARVTTAEGRLTTNEAAITAEQTARANADTAEATARTTLAARVTAAEGSIADNANDIAENLALIQSEQTARANADSALASSVTTLQSTVGGHTTSIQTQQTTLNGIVGEYTIKIDANGVVAGIGLINGPQGSEIGVRAGRFFIVDPAAPNNRLIPFIVSGGKVYIDIALIADATITNAKLQNLAVDEAKIANAAVTTLKVADGAITTLKVADAAITSLKVADAAITNAKIGSAAITTAKIGDAQVDTLRIKGNAVTIPKTGTGGTSASCTITLVESYPGETFNLLVEATITNIANGGQMLINRNGGSVLSVANVVYGPVTQTLLDSGLSAGTYTYTTGGTAGYCASSTITVMAVLR